jgi:hypothetical protein
MRQPEVRAVTDSDSQARPEFLLRPEISRQLALSDEQIARLKSIAVSSDASAGEKALAILSPPQLAEWHRLTARRD